MVKGKKRQMAPKFTVDTKFGKLHFFEKSVRVDGITETLYIGGDIVGKTADIIGFLEKIYIRGRKDKRSEIKNVLLSD